MAWLQRRRLSDLRWYTVLAGEARVTESLLARQVENLGLYARLA